MYSFYFNMFLYLLVCFAVGQVAGSSGDPMDVPKGGRPFQASLRLHDVVRGGDSHFCSGAILNQQLVVTAGRCLVNNRVHRIRVFSRNGLWYEAERTIIHENYNRLSVANDIGLVKTKNQIEFNDYVSAISLPKSDTPAGSRCVLSGYGYSSRNGRYSGNLQAANETTISTEECRNTELKRYQSTLPVSDKQICAFSDDGLPVCSNDKGAPLTKDDELVGLESYRLPCSQRFPNVFVRVYDYKDWISNHMND